MMLASGVAPIVQMQRAGIDIALGTDGPAGSNNKLDMVEEMASAARLQKVFRNDPKALAAREVLGFATVGGARALNMADKIGSLEAGKRADIAIIDFDQPKTQPVYAVESAIVYAASGSSVVTTICDGKILMRDRKVLTVDVPLLGRRERDLRNDFTLPAGIGMVHAYEPAWSAAADDPARAWAGPFANRTLTWDDLKWIRAAGGGLPLLLKGVVRGDDAL